MVLIAYTTQWSHVTRSQLDKTSLQHICYILYTSNSDLFFSSLLYWLKLLLDNYIASYMGHNLLQCSCMFYSKLWTFQNRGFFFYIRLWDTGIVGRMLRTDLIHIFGDRQYATNHIGKSQIWCRVAYCWENIWNLMNKCHHPIVIQDIITLIKYLFVG